MSTTDTKLKKLLDVEVDLLEKFKSICEKHDLKYYAFAGTLLGAVRHGGFIPWDDDIDVAMMWSDYVRFREVAAKECEYPYCFRQHRTDGRYGKLRRSDTTGFTKWEYENIASPDHDWGLFIDIFPLFYVPDSEEERAKQKQEVMKFWSILKGYDVLQYRKRTGIINPSDDQHVSLYEEYCAAHDRSEADILQIRERYLEACAWVNTPSSTIGATSYRCHSKRTMFDAALYEETVLLPFENTTISCPKGYERSLEISYGDWRTPVRGAGSHVMAAVEPEIPWREFDMSKLDLGK